MSDVSCVFSVVGLDGVTRNYRRFFVFRALDRVYGAFHLVDPGTEESENADTTFLFLWDPERSVYVSVPEDEGTERAEGAFFEEYAGIEVQILENLQEPSPDEARVLAEKWAYLLGSSGLETKGNLE